MLDLPRNITDAVIEPSTLSRAESLFSGEGQRDDRYSAHCDSRSRAAVRRPAVRISLPPTGDAACPSAAVSEAQKARGRQHCRTSTGARHRAVTMTFSDLLHHLLALLSPGGRELARRRRRADTEATIAAERIEAARLLAGIASCQLRLSELDRRDVELHPGLAGPDADLRETLGDILRHEVYSFWQRTEEGS